RVPWSRARAWPVNSRVGEGGFARFSDGLIAFPAFIFQFDVLDGNGVRVRVEIRQGLIFADPRAINFVGEDDLPGFVIDFENEILAKVFERNFRAETVSKVPNFVRPLLEFGVVGDAAFERDGVILGAAGRFSRAARITAFAMLDDFGGALEAADFADSRHVFAVPLDAELEILIRVEPAGIDAELCHNSFLLGLDLSGDLLNLNDHKLRRFQRREADEDVHDAPVDVVLGGGFLVALHEVGFLRRLALKRALSEKSLHERAKIQPDLRPER